MKPSVNPLWYGTPSARLAKLLIARNPTTAKAEVERIVAEIRQATYAVMGTDVHRPGYDDEWDDKFQSAVTKVVDEMEATP